VGGIGGFQKHTPHTLPAQYFLCTHNPPVVYNTSGWYCSMQLVQRRHFCRRQCEVENTKVVYHVLYGECAGEIVSLIVLLYIL
jgi:hypothetical protein